MAPSMISPAPKTPKHLTPPGDYAETGPNQPWPWGAGWTNSPTSRRSDVARVGHVESLCPRVGSDPERLLAYRDRGPDPEQDAPSSPGPGSVRASRCRRRRGGRERDCGNRRSDRDDDVPDTSMMSCFPGDREGRCRGQPPCAWRWSNPYLRLGTTLGCTGSGSGCNPPVVPISSSALPAAPIMLPRLAAASSTRSATGRESRGH